MKKYLLITRQQLEELNISADDVELFYRKTEMNSSTYNVVAEVFILDNEDPRTSWLKIKYPELEYKTFD